MKDGTIDSCEFVSNSAAGGDGGAVRCGSATITASVFKNNRSNFDPVSYGGAISCGAAEILNCTFEGNHANGSTEAWGGAVAAGSASMEACIFVDNSVSSSGGGGAVCFGPARSAIASS